MARVGRKPASSMKDHTLINFGRILVLLDMVKEVPGPAKKDKHGKELPRALIPNRAQVEALTEAQKKTACNKVATELPGWLNLTCAPKKAASASALTAEKDEKIAEMTARIAELEALLPKHSKGKAA